MPNQRVMPPATGNATIMVNGRTYSGSVGSFLDVPDFDARVMIANGWTTTDSAGVGTTLLRPPTPKKDTHYTDTDLGVSIVFDGKTWRSKATGASV
jgi:hypothetical protein